MKYFIFFVCIFSFILIPSHKAKSNCEITSLNIENPDDCNCQELIKEGMVIKQCQILPLSNDDNTQVGIGISKIDKSCFISLTVRFKNNSMEIDKNYELSLWLEDGSVIDLKYLNGGLSYFGNSHVSQAIYIIEQDQESNLKSSGIKTIAFKFNDGIRRCYQTKLNKDIIQNELNCLEKLSYKQK